MVASFGALGAALLTSVKLSDLGNFEGAEQTVVIIAAIVGLLGAIAVVWFGTVLLASGRIGLNDLVGSPVRKARVRAELDALTPSPYVPFDSAEKFVKQLSDYWAQQAESLITYYTTHDERERAEAKAKYDRASQILPELSKLNSRLLASARHEDVRLTFNRVRYLIGVGAIMAAAGIGTFAVIGKPSKEEAATLPAVAYQPVRAEVDVRKDSKDALSETLGKGCNLDKIPALAVASKEGAIEVITDPGDDGKGCNVARLQITDDIGVVRPLEPLGGLDPPNATAP